ncbi:hypothetical protein SpCBS45565_g07410 [Spizellomyces sp. 'palustris']|nr:hypothetical protein SpCBS45565_g07410 [Spizellomyces sp. 'palustris']
MSPAEELKFATHFLHQLASQPIQYQLNYEPPLSNCHATLPPASRPFPLREPDDAATSPSAKELEINIKPLKGGQVFTIHSSRLEPIGDIKSRIATEAGIPIAAQRLVYNGKGLVDTKTLLDYEIVSGATIHLLKKPVAASQEKHEEAPTDTAHSRSKATHTTSTSPTDVFKIKGNNPAFWKELRELTGQHFGPEHAGVVFGEFVKSYHGLCGPLTVRERDALKKAEAASV